MRFLRLIREAAVKAPAYIQRRRRSSAIVLLSVAGLLLMGMVVMSRSAPPGALVATVRRGPLVARLTATGALKPLQSITYRSPLSGREAEIVFLVAEGTLVGEGDLLVRLDTTDLQRELERAVQEMRQAELDLRVAEAERAEGEDAIESLTEGEGALGIEEARSRLAIAERKVQRLRGAHEANTPLLQSGFITREELDRSAFELEQAEAEVALARRKAQILVERTHPRSRQRARLVLSQKEAQVGNARARVMEARARVKALREDIDHCRLHARAPGLVVYEEHLGASPRRKVRPGDRVTGSQGLVTIPEVSRMVVEASVAETDVHRLKPGQRAAVRLDAFPDLSLTGKVARVGTLARVSSERPYEEKRFDLVVDVDPASAELRPEMTARVDVVVSERRGVLLVPVNAVFERQGILVAHVLRPLGTETRQVELGESDDFVAEVLAGLDEGDRVSLADAPPGSGAANVVPAPASRPYLRSGEPQGTPLAPR